MIARYFNWLYDQVFKVRDEESPISYVNVCRHLHSVHFNDSVPNDSNRTRDAEELRNEFIATLKNIGVGEYAEIYGLGKATLLEVFIALSRRCVDQADMEEWGPAQWFALFLDNLGLLKYSDANYVPRDDLRIGRVLITFNERRYSPLGRGGIFPLRQNKGRDQRELELWFQMAAYMTENRMF